MTLTGYANRNRVNLYYDSDKYECSHKKINKCHKQK